MLLYRRIRFGYSFRRIPLTQGKFATVDTDDYSHLAEYKWRICTGKNTLYAERSVHSPSGRYSRVLMHRRILNIPRGFVIDHINRNGLDNRRANLRPATVAQNAWNCRRRKNRTGYKGVWYVKDKGLFRAAIVCNRKRIHLGYFKKKVEAARAYDEAAKKYHKDFAVLNFKNV